MVFAYVSFSYFDRYFTLVWVVVAVWLGCLELNFDAWVVVCDLQMRLLWMFCFAAFVWVLLCGLFCLNVAGDCDLGLVVELLFLLFL